MMDRRTEREILIACILGDGSIVWHRQQNSFWLKLSHAPAQRDYLMWKVALLESTRLVKGKHFTIRDQKNVHSNGKTYPVVTANLYGVRYFRILRKWIYPQGTKTSRRVLKYLASPLALAILFMDDGCVVRRKRKHKDGTAYLITPKLSLGLCRPEEECLEFLTWLATTFGIQGYPMLNTRKDAPNVSYVLRFNIENSRKLWALIEPFVTPFESMKKKFDLCFERFSSATGVARVSSTPAG